ncbi:MAG: SusC/RagA family TonB-linked outer membrane protein [Gemmatimonadetes bacterium]|nr:SusC/RagA family TonB-linked outer membrane protein [Gemmatimonadota bacterium]
MLKRMLLLLMSFALLGGVHPAAAQQRQISGTVSGANQAPLAGAAVTITGTRRGVVTDARGHFAIAVPEGEARFTVSQLGYTSKQVVVPAGQSTLDVRLEQDVLNLEGLVVTGQATSVRRQNVANAVAVVSAQELERAPAQTVEKALQGKIAGAAISTNSGAPGGGAQVRIRGVSSLIGNSEPLYVVDGVVLSNASIPGGANVISGAGTRTDLYSVQDNVVNRVADINPADIENVEVLKGASASAIYGSKAANGVVIITTKRGRAGKTQYRLSQRFGYSEQSRELGSRDWTRDEAIAQYCPSKAASCLAELITPYFNADGSPVATYDNEAAVFGRRAPGRETNLTVSGGTEATRYYVSGTLLDEKGIAANTGYQKQGVRVSVDQNLGSRGKISASNNLLHSVAARGLTGNDNNGVSYYAAISFTPSFYNLARQENGLYLANPFAASNPVQTAAMSQNDENVWRNVTALNFSYDLLHSDRQSLRAVATGGVDYFLQRNILYYPPTLQFEPNDKLPGTAVNANAGSTDLTGNANLVHTFSPTSGSFTATTSVGAQYSDVDLTFNTIAGRNLTGDIRIPELAANVKVDGYRTRNRDLGVFAQEELLMFSDRLNLTGSLRADRSSGDADPEKYYYYPKAAASFRFGELAGWLNDFKVRGAFGSSGNQPLFGQKFTRLQPGVNVEGNPALTVQGNVGAPDLRPERATELEGGFDATLFGGNARFEFTAYNKRVTDFLLSRGLASSTGFVTYYFNGGALNAHGIEMMLEATPVRTAGFDWISRTTFAANRQKIVDLPVPAFRPASSSFGFLYGGYKIQDEESPTAMIGYAGRDATKTGSPRIEKVYGDAEPDFQMGFTNDFHLGRFTLSSLLDWSKGGLIANLTRSYYDDAANSPDYLRPSNVTKTRTLAECGPRCLSGEEREELTAASYSVYIEDASFLKLREVSLTYELPGNMLGRIGNSVSDARISLSARNPWMWTAYTGLDPEVSNFGNRSVGRNIDVTPFPPSRSFWLTVNLGF